MKKGNNKKKGIERFHLDKFLLLKNIEIDTIIEGESPDFILKLKDQTISIEHTRFIQPKSKQIEEFKEKIVSLAKQEFKKLYQVELTVWVTFHNFDFKFQKGYLESYAKEVFQIVEESYLTDTDYDFHHYPENKKYSRLVSSVDILKNLDQDHWQSFGCFIVPPVDEKSFIQLIRQKEKILDNYKSNYSENWLLIVADLGHESSTFCYSNFITKKLTSDFDRIYLFGYMPNSFLRLI